MRDPSQLPDQPIDPLGDPARLMSWPSLIRATGKGRSQIYALMQLGKFPQPISTGRRQVAWVAADVAAWLASQEADRNRG